MTRVSGMYGRDFLATIRRGATRGGLGLVCCACALLMVSPTAAASAPTHRVAIGAPLTKAPNVSFDCTLLPYEVSPEKINTPSCMWGTPLVPGTAEGGLDVPGTGTIYQVKLRVGSSTGRMRLVILRTLFDPNDLSNNKCCVLVARSSIFKPVRNGITTLNVKLPVRLGAFGNNVVLDQVGLQVLEDKVAIPLINETNLPIGNQLGDQPFDNYNTSALTLGGYQLAGDPAGYRLDMRAEWYPPGQHP